MVLSPRSLLREVLLAGAIFVLAGAAAARADDNSIDIVQNGNTHEGSLIQTGTGNVAGTDTLHLTQNGVDNFLSITQSGDDNDIGTILRGVLQTGTVSDDNARANSATVLQNSDGNSIGELVQTTEGTHATTGNTLTVTQNIGRGSGNDNTIVSIEQVAGSGAGANTATVTQTGISNWLQTLSQRSSGGSGNNWITFVATGNNNGFDGSGIGTLAPLAGATGALASSLVQDTGTSGGGGNVINLTITGNSNQFGMQQVGVDNGAGITITGLSNSFGSYQFGRHNQITAGGIAGDGNDMGIRQDGEANVASAVLNWSSSDNRIAIGQLGDSNDAGIALRGDGNLFGISQRGRGHIATITATGDNNLALAVQYNDGSTNSVGNTLTLSITGMDNNGLAGGLASFTGDALLFAERAPLLGPTLLLSPDASALLPAAARSGGGLLLVPGVLAQWGEDNEMTIRVGNTRSSDFNLFAALQKGDRNTIVASIDGSYNQFVALQRGNDNIALASIDGNHNLVAISQ
jgi:hypothetical protein